MIRVLVVDDSALMRKLIPQLLERDTEIHVVGTAMDGAFALKKIEEYRPDAITLDLEMPRMDGIETLRQIMRSHQVPVVVVSAHTREGASHHLQGAAHGSLRLCRQAAKCSGRRHAGNRRRADRKDQGRRRQSLPPPRPAGRRHRRPAQTQADYAGPVPASKVVAIGISTGGPNSLEFMLSQLPADFAAAILVVQHMPVGFTDTFARRLNDSCSTGGQGGAIRRSGRRRTGANLPRRPPHEDPPHAPGRCHRALRRCQGQRPPPVRRCPVPLRRPGVRRRGHRPADDRHGRRRSRGTGSR